MANVLDCDIVVSDCKLQSCTYVHFLDNYTWKRYELLYPPAMVWIAPQLTSSKDGFGIESPTKFDVQLNKDIENTKI